MFSERSRYAGTPTCRVRLQDGRAGAREVTAVVFGPRPRPTIAGYHRREAHQRLDHLAAHYLKLPTGFWRLCDASAAISAHALAARPLVAIPAPER